MSELIDIKTAAERDGCSIRMAYFYCEPGGKWYRFVRIFNGRKMVSTDADPRFVLKEVPMKDSAELQNLPVKKRDQALLRLGIIQDFVRFYASIKREHGLSKSEAVSLYSAEHNISRRKLWRMMSTHRREGVAGLIDKRGGGKFLSQMISPEALETFKSMYLDLRQPSVKQCWQNICFVNKDQRKGWKIPALHVMYRYIKDQIPYAVQVLRREGIDAYNAKCAPYIQFDPDGVEPGQVWIGDHSQLNCWVRHRNKWVRPWITAWQDMRSRAIVGWYICSSPNQSTILLAMKRAVDEYGPPESVKIDNGRDYDSEAWTGTTKAKRKAFLRAGYIDEPMVAGIYAMMNVTVSFAIPYHPQSKPIERFFDTLDMQFTKTIPTYCGKDTNRRPEYIKDMLSSEKAVREAYSLERFAAKIEDYVGVYNQTAHTGAGMNGESPDQVMATRSSRRVMAEGVSELLLRIWGREQTVTKNGVRLKGMYFGQWNPELLMAQGKNVRIAYDPYDMRQVYVYESATMRLITIAEQNQLIQYGSPVSEEHLRFAMRQKSKALKLMKGFVDSSLTANTDLTTLTIKAMQDVVDDKRESKPETRDAGIKTIRPVRTPLDDQVREHQRQQVIKAVRKAAGAESTKAVLDMDFSILQPKNKYEGRRLFDD